MNILSEVFNVAHLSWVGFSVFFTVFASGVLVKVLSDLLLDKKLRQVYVANIVKNAKIYIVLAILLLICIPVGFSETEIHRQGANGQVNVEIIRTPQEQNFAEHAYQTPDGGRMIYLGSGPNAGAVSREAYIAQAQANHDALVANNQNIVQGAHDAWKNGSISKDEFFETHSQIKVINGNSERQVSAVKSAALNNQPLDIAKSKGNVTVYVQAKDKPRVLVS